MTKPELPPDPDSLAKWAKLPQNKPSKEALPPVAGGARWALWFLVILSILLVLALLAQNPPG